MSLAESSAGAYDVHLCVSTFLMMTTLSGVTSEAAALVDTACAKSVAGLDWADTMMKLCVERIADHEIFSFGPGKRMYSSFALISTVAWGSITVAFRILIVPKKNVPCLFS